MLGSACPSMCLLWVRDLPAPGTPPGWELRASASLSGGGTGQGPPSRQGKGPHEALLCPGSGMQGPFPASQGFPPQAGSAGGRQQWVREAQGQSCVKPPAGARSVLSASPQPRHARRPQRPRVHPPLVCRPSNSTAEQVAHSPSCGGETYPGDPTQRGPTTSREPARQGS